MTDYLVVIEREGSSWGAYCPDLPGVSVVGRSEYEVESLIDDAVALHVAALRRAGEGVPAPSAAGARTVTVR